MEAFRILIKTYTDDQFYEKIGANLSAGKFDDIKYYLASVINNQQEYF